MNGKTVSGPQKHSLTLRGHRTSVTLEAEFWAAFQRLAQKRQMSINALAAEMDAARGDIGLASYMRVAILRDLLGG
ncbi:MAG: ribbon-helix-helix domain-containing protein [Cypionkella sp.]|nr:ribbon-helix-helix domain-containing protein [Cypionkella sp.]